MYRSVIDVLRVKITTPPVEEPVSLSEIKDQLRIDHDVEDALLNSMITAARIHCENIARRVFVTRTYTAYLDNWPYMTRFELPYPPLIGITSVKYYDNIDSPAFTFAASNYFVDAYSEPGRFVLKAASTWPIMAANTTLQEINGVELIYTAGYGLADDVPETYKLAIRAYVGAFYENREQFVVQPGLSSVTIPFVDNLLMTDRGSW